MNTTIPMMALVATVLLSSCGGEKKEPETRDESIPVKTVSIQREEYALPVISSGVITSDKEAHLSFKTGGIISAMYVTEGQAVKKGQLLATLNLTEINAQVLQAQTGYDKALRDYKRVENLYNDSALTLEQLQNAGSGLTVARQSLQIAKFNKQYSSIYANASGKVIRKHMNEGELASPGAPVYTINSTNDRDWVIRTGVADRDWARLKKGDKATLTLDAYPGKTLTATVTEIAEAADQFTGTFQIKLQVHPSGVKLANGLIAKIEIAPSLSEQLVMVPIEAITEADRTFGNVYSIKNGKTAQKHSINIAYIIKDKVAVRSGLDSVTEIITDGASYLSEGAKVHTGQH